MVPPLATPDSTMEMWFLFLGGAIFGGFLVLHGFGDAKGSSDHVLNVYQELIKRASERRADEDVSES
jgi:hypothetical protein